MKEDTLYQKIEHDLTTKILDGTLPAGAQLMPENQLTEHYGVSRITIRNAMSNLVERGLVQRVRGKGSFVIANGDATLKDASRPSGVASPQIAAIFPRFRDAHDTGILDSIYRTADALGYTVSIHQTYHDQTMEERCIRECVRRGVAGIIVYPVQNDKYNEEIIKLVLRRFPIVLVDRSLEGINVNSVATDNESAAHEATKHLIDLGHTRIGLVTSPPEYAAPLRSRYEGYLRAHNEAGLIADERLLSYYNSGNIDENMDMELSMMSSQIRTSREFIEGNRDMTALICTEPIEGVAMMLAARELGRRLPETLSMIFFDEFPMADLFFVPPTVVRQNSREIGKIATELLHGLVAGEETDSKHIEVPAELVLRQSTFALHG